ncbi:MAG: sensor histidine kinase [Roseiflexaceae bacterium]
MKRKRSRGAIFGQAAAEPLFNTAEAQQWLAALVDSSNDAIIGKRLDGVVTSWNAAARRIYGYTAEEMIGASIVRVIPPDRIEEFTQIMGRLQQGHRVEHFETVRLRKDGARIDVSITISPVKNAAGQIIGASTIARDITERKLAEEERAQLLAREQAARAEAQEAVQMRDVFLSVASHELRTPLTSLLGNAQLLQRRAQQEGASTGRNEQAITVIVEQARRLGKMIAALLDLSRIEMGQLSIEHEPVDVCALVRRVVAEVQPVLDRHRVECVGTDAPLLVEGDELRLEQVLQNLIQNAIKYSPEGELVVVRVEQRGGQAYVAVADQGIGIPPQALPRLFERLYRASNVGEWQISGMGIGLYVVREIIALHGGTVEVRSEEGRGSTFAFSLPLPDQVAISSE